MYALVSSNKKNNCTWLNNDHKQAIEEELIMLLKVTRADINPIIDWVVILVAFADSDILLEFVVLQ